MRLIILLVLLALTGCKSDPKPTEHKTDCFKCKCQDKG